jgi:hypothetical protein
MEQTTYASRLRYLDADDIDDSAVDFDGLDVRGTDGSKLGDVDGFLVDPASGRVLYTVVDSGGWFSSRRFLVPIGHATVDSDARALRVDVSRDSLSGYPEFDEERFSTLSDADFKTYEHRMAAVCCPDDVSGETWRSETGRHYRQPAWWSAGAYGADRLRPVTRRPYRDRATGAVAAPAAASPSRETFDRERVVAREESRSADDVSPHLGGRAQPGDVLGIETGGETTGIGDTAEDEDKRRREAEKSPPVDEKTRR